MDVMSKEKRHKIMTAIKSKNTRIEIILRKSLWHRGLRYRNNIKVCNCHPDIVITKYKIAIFCDGDFWHGKTFEQLKFQNNATFWEEKIKRNKERDLENTIVLRDNGWTVLRFWETDINNNLNKCVESILKEVQRKQKSMFPNINI